MDHPVYIHNGRIWTGIPGDPWATTLRVAGGRVIALNGPRTARDAALDLEGRTALPGLIDAHLHLVLGGQALTELDLSGASSRAAFEELVAERHACLRPDDWLVARGWSEASWPGARLPDKSWLRRAGPRPAVAYRSDLHAALVNDAVLAQLDLSADPEGGRIVRDGRGAPTGLLLEAAAWQLVNPLVPSPGTEARRAALLAAQAHAHRLGLTMVGTMEYERTVREVLAPLRDQLTLRCRVTLLDRDWPMTFDAGRRLPGDDRLAVIGYKAFLDGTLGSGTARMRADYADEPGQRGMLVELAARGHLAAWAGAVAAAGLSPSMHAIGDEAVGLALDVAVALPASARPRLEHVQHVDPTDVPRLRGLVASMQPLHKAVDGPTIRRRLGAARTAFAFAFRTIADAGAVLAFGSDWPVVSCDPMAGVRAAVTGQTVDGTVLHPEQSITVEEAFAAYTRGAARALGAEDAGVLGPGALADLTVLDRDPFATDWSAVAPRVVATIVGGRIVYDARRDEVPAGVG